MRGLLTAVLGLLLTACTAASDCDPGVLHDGGQRWLVGGGLGRVFSGGAWSSAPQPRGPATRTSGSDRHGRFTAVACDWPATAASPALRTTVRTYPQHRATVYELLFVDGANATNVSAPGAPRAQHSMYGVNTDGVAPFAEFPVFDLSRGMAANSSWMTWHGGLQYHDTGKGTVDSGAGLYDTFLKNLTGLSGGPMVLFDESAGQARPFPTAVVSPMSNIRLGASLVRPAASGRSGCSRKRAASAAAEACLWSHGPSWELTSVPPGFAHRTLLVTGSDGIRPTMASWGEFLLAEFQTTRLPDPTLDMLGVFTDNGAFYDAGYWPSFQHNKQSAGAILAELAADYKQHKTPVHCAPAPATFFSRMTRDYGPCYADIQLDDWWYGNATARAQTQERIVVCTQSFSPTTVGGAADGPPLFPSGLLPLKAQFGGLMLYMVNFCPVRVQRFELVGLIDRLGDSQTIAVQDNDYLSRADAAVSFPDAKGRVFLMPKAEVAERTFGKLMDDGVRQGMTAFEIDFMEKNFEAVPYLRDTAGAADGVLMGLSRAAAARGLPTQLCSDSPRDVIAAAAMPAVTQFRGSLDYACDCGAEPLSGNWDVGQQTLLISSLGLGASKDTFMTQGEEKGINHKQAGNCTVDNGHAELDLFLATLSGGPVGFGDGIGDTDRALLMRCCTDDGRILRATSASTPIDATWAAGRSPPASQEPPKAAAAIWSAHTSINASVFHFVTAIDVPTSFPLLPADLWPAPSGPLVRRAWHSPVCVDGAQAAACGVAAGLGDARTGLPAGRCQNKTQDKSTCTAIGAHRWELTTISPVTSGGVALLGELSKVVSVSPARFREAATTTEGGLRVTVVGTPGERVELAFVVGHAPPAKMGTVRTAVATIAADGEATATVQPAENEEFY